MNSQLNFDIEEIAKEIGMLYLQIIHLKKELEKLSAGSENNKPEFSEKS